MCQYLRCVLLAAWDCYPSTEPEKIINNLAHRNRTSFLALKMFAISALSVLVCITVTLSVSKSMLQKRERNVQKSAKLLFCLLNLYIYIYILTFSLPSASLDLKVSNVLRNAKISLVTSYENCSIDLFSLYVLLSLFRLRDAHALKGICLLSFLQSPSQSLRYGCLRCPFRWTRATRTQGTRLSFLELHYACLLTEIGRYLIPSRATILVNSPTSTVT